MVFSSVTSLSDDDAEAAGPAEAEAAAPPSPSARPRKRRRKTMSPKRSSTQMTVDEMVAKLRQPCSCKKIDCFQQFSSEPKLSSFKAYFEEWMSLSKLDKDNLVCLAPFQFVSGHMANCHALPTTGPGVWPHETACGKGRRGQLH